jgi:ketol-acid reductoisomerase
MRDSGITVIVGNREDEFKKQAEEDGFEVFTIAEAARRGDFLLLLTADEVQPQVYEESVARGLEKGKLLDFASGYNITYRLIVPPPDVDVVMVAPRMIGEQVRGLFVQGKGSMALLGIHQNATGQAKERALAIAKAIGVTRGGVFESSFEEEAHLDLFAEQVVWAGIMEYLKVCYEIGVERGINPDLMVMELYASGEPAEIFAAMAARGFYKQMEYHSHTSQYGTLSRGRRIITDEVRRTLVSIFEEDVLRGHFANEWTKEQSKGLPNFNRMKREALSHPLNAVEARVLQMLVEAQA